MMKKIVVLLLICATLLLVGCKEKVDYIDMTDKLECLSTEPNDWYGVIINSQEEYENQPRQELKPMFIRNGAIYATRKEVLMGGSFKGINCQAWIMEPIRSINIDTEMDMKYAEWLISEGLV